MILEVELSRIAQEGRSGAEYKCNQLKIKESISLGKYSVVFQIEVLALMDCAKKNKTALSYITMESQYFLNKSEMISVLVLEFFNELEQLGTTNIQTLALVPRHGHRY